MKPDPSKRHLTRGEKETETEAARLIEHIEVALSAVAVRSPDEADSLNAAADRIERAARDLSAALRELADQRRSSENALEQ
jgi:ABC-type transporter Mla subunit MlaD